MIGKIDPKTISDYKTISAALSLRLDEKPDFQSILEEKVELFSPLERSIIEYLIHTIATILMKTTSEEKDLFLAPQLFLNLPTQSLPISNQPDSMSSPPLPEVSNNLHKEYDFDHIIEEASRLYGVESALVKAVIKVESAGNPQAVSPAGAQGLMQLMPNTAAELGVTHPFDPVQNIMGGTRYLRQLLDRYQGDIRLALAAYNWGMGNLEKRPNALPKETQSYIFKVENLYRPKTVS